jgi:three-Cys-motif partner protein
VVSGLLEISKHALHKYSILRKYFQACLKFQEKYRNFSYIDTHGGSGRVLFEGIEQFGSPLIAAKSAVHPQTYVVEINQTRRLLLRKSVAGIPNVEIFEGDCNKRISEILSKIESWKFAFCFLDPDGLVYDDGTTRCFQLTWQTVELVGKRSNSELLINFRSQDVLRCIGDIGREPDRGLKLSQDVDALLGSPSWRSQPQTRFTLRDLFLERLHSLGYSYLGAINIKTDLEVHQYYLIYASHHQVGAKIMKSNFKIEWGYKLLIDPPLDRFIYDDAG